ncbi:unnamed protein product [Acanthoscelides obtectus]|uniref:DUF4371 domain-containing protein n=1 Tax=Acanthoscelides obtectus TaxID=200917 RepID=A0A9P0LFR7_ACAOB|nr:unnamed protein product [Acanthoscelides obtectus]CAK1669868.1 Zinc finger BED domain-containing protein 5 [Acanthoscelides obtectus]
MAAKKRKFSEDYVKFGFTFIEKDELQLPQCVIRVKVFCNDSMRPNRLERHLKQQHPTLVLKTKEFFSSKAESLNRMRLDKLGSYHTVYVRYVGGDIIQEEILYSQSLTARTTSEDIFNSISNFVEKNDLDWKKLIGLCTDGAPAMIGVRWGLAKKLKEKNPAMVSTHCGFQNVATEITPDFGLGYKDCKQHQEQRFEQSVIYFTLRGSRF